MGTRRKLRESDDGSESSDYWDGCTVEESTLFCHTYRRQGERNLKQLWAAHDQESSSKSTEWKGRTTCYLEAEADTVFCDLAGMNLSTSR